MEIKSLPGKLKSFAEKYRYALLIAVVGLVLLLIPGKQEQKNTVVTDTSPVIMNHGIDTQMLTDILQTVQGAGKVKVMLSVASGERTQYQINSDISKSGDSSSTQTEAVIITDSARNENGLISQVDPPVYLGAIVVCQGADSAAVRLAITQAVAKITGLGADAICVLKME